MSYTCFDYQTIQYELFGLRFNIEDNLNQIAMALSNFMVDKKPNRRMPSTGVTAHEMPFNKQEIKFHYQ